MNIDKVKNLIITMLEDIYNSSQDKLNTIEKTVVSVAIKKIREELGSDRWDDTIKEYINKVKENKTCPLCGKKIK